LTDGYKINQSPAFFSGEMQLKVKKAALAHGLSMHGGKILLSVIYQIYDRSR
jgi:hypothetical protein